MITLGRTDGSEKKEAKENGDRWERLDRKSENKEERLSQTICEIWF